MSPKCTGITFILHPTSDRRWRPSHTFPLTWCNLVETGSVGSWRASRRLGVEMMSRFCGGRRQTHDWQIWSICCNTSRSRKTAKDQLLSLENYSKWLSAKNVTAARLKKQFVVAFLATDAEKLRLVFLKRKQRSKWKKHAMVITGSDALDGRSQCILNRGLYFPFGWLCMSSPVNVWRQSQD